MGVYESLFDLDQRVAIITGGSKGLGLAMATGLAEYGAHIVIADKDANEAEYIVDRIIQSTSVKVLFIQTDISQKDQVEQMVRQTLDTLGKIDILVNNAGISHRSSAVDFEEKDFTRVIDINLKGTFLCSQAVGREMIQSGNGGSIINISSIAGVVGVPHTIAYSCSKGGVTQLTRALALEWAPYGIRVNGIAPCPFETALSKKTFEEHPEVYQDLIRQIPLGRAGQTEDIVGAVLFLASDASQMVTGHILAVDGGWTAQ